MGSNRVLGTSSSPPVLISLARLEFLTAVFLEIKAQCFFETAVNVYLTTYHKIPVDFNVQHMSLCGPGSSVCVVTG